ncbi:MAG: response regulator transcription factor [Lachnospiraceae bacterium]|nr:response regulator transcription factor [Lachnospiraceae bacterium]
MALIYIVEDDKNIAEIESFALRNVGYDVETFFRARDFYRALERRVPDLFLLDIMLPDEDGLEILRTLKADPKTSYPPVILVTAKTSEMDKVKGLDQGADDYMTKPFGVMELISRVKALLRRTKVIGAVPFVLAFESIRMEEEKHLVTVDGKTCELTYKEYELLKLLMINAGIVTSREVVLEKIWGTDFEGESRTLDVHMKSLRKKLGEAGSYIKTVRNVGYILTRED